MKSHLIYCITSIPCSEYLIISFLMGFCVALITMVSDVSQILMNLSSRPAKQANDTFLTLQMVKGEQSPWELLVTRERNGEQSLELQVPRWAKQDLILTAFIFLPMEGLTDRTSPQPQLPVLSTHPGHTSMSAAAPGNTLPSSCSPSHISTCLTQRHLLDCS